MQRIFRLPVLLAGLLAINMAPPTSAGCGAMAGCALVKTKVIVVVYPDEPVQVYYECTYVCL